MHVIGTEGTPNFLAKIHLNSDAFCDAPYSETYYVILGPPIKCFYVHGSSEAIRSSVPARAPVRAP